MYINRQPDNQVYEFENLEELRRRTIFAMRIIRDQGMPEDLEQVFKVL